MPSSGFGGLTSRYDLYKPVIAAVNGFAMGGGFEIALAADIIIAAENAKFALPEPKVGFAALASGMHRLPQAGAAEEGDGHDADGPRRVGAAEGKEIGFVTEVVPQGKALEEAKRWAGMILECSPMAIKATKETVLTGLNTADLKTAFDHKVPGIAKLMALGRSQGRPEGVRREAQAGVEERVAHPIVSSGQSPGGGMTEVSP